MDQEIEYARNSKKALRSRSCGYEKPACGVCPSSKKQGQRVWFPATRRENFRNSGRVSAGNQKGESRYGSLLRSGNFSPGTPFWRDRPMCDTDKKKVGQCHE